MKEGLFVVFEGIDGCGKSTQIKLLADNMREAGIDLLLLREPGGTRIGDSIRDVVHNKQFGEMDKGCELFLYLASRAQNVGENIRPALEQGKLVLCDRYKYSTVAYQGYGRGWDIGNLNVLNEVATGGVEADVVVLLDLSPELGLSRRKRSGEEINRMDLQEELFYKQVREGYLELAKNDTKWVLVEAVGTIDEVFERIQEALLLRLLAIGMLNWADRLSGARKWRQIL